MFPNTRLRRTRMYDWSRRLIQENNITTSDLILPLFIKEGKNVIEEIKSMPDVYKYSIDTLKKIIKEAIRYKIPAVALFPEINNNKKNEIGSEALNKNNLICNAVREIKKSFGNSIGVICDVALDPYTSHGHDGIVKKNIVDNDETIKILIEQSLNQAEAGCDILAPSDMMDGRIGEIRKSLEKNNYKNIQLLSYAAKYASNFYGPFRNAVGSQSKLKSDKKNYQMDFKNSKEALREIGMDINEGADMVIVKPALTYLDIISKAKQEFNIPIVAYNVSGEYSMIKNAIKNNILPEDAINEMMISFKRAGANSVITYFAMELARKLDN
ncbi:MAG: porphobilinogen synthase [Proteobacteria bacterium]|jgi:porphobilinogen synthase|nr:porphobilinogen synthase [Pseudomonadota bacterium]